MMSFNPQAQALEQRIAMDKRREEEENRLDAIDRTSMRGDSHQDDESKGVMSSVL